MTDDPSIMGRPLPALAGVAQVSLRSRTYGWLVVILLTAAFMLSLLDRTVLTLFVDPIKRDLSISDTQFSLLFGAAFTLLYVVAGVPLGWLADRYQRRLVAFGAILGWSVATAACALSGGFWRLFGARMLVGVGEAGLAPAAISIIADSFAPDEVAKPTALFSSGGLLGGGFALVFGGVVAAVVEGHGPFRLPLVGDVKGWQAALLMLGLAGSVFSLLFLLIEEPPRRLSPTVSPVASLGDVLTFLWRRAGFFIPYFAGVGSATMAVVGFNTWLPSLFIRKFHWSAFHTGAFYGSAMVLGGILGSMAAGAWVDRARGRGLPNAYLWALLAGAACAAPVCIAAPLIPGAGLAAALTALALVFVPIASALGAVGIQNECPSHMRGRGMGLYIIVQSLGGWFLGPLVVALLTDRLFHDPGQVGRSLAMASGGGLLLAVAMFALAIRNHSAALDDIDLSPSRVDSLEKGYPL